MQNIYYIGLFFFVVRHGEFRRAVVAREALDPVKGRLLRLHPSDRSRHSELV
jgi:hypothetical protein